MRPDLVDAVVHVLVQDETKFPEQRCRLIAGIGCKNVRADISRPFAEEEYEKLPQRYKDLLQKDGYCLEGIPNHSSAIKPFSTEKLQ